MQLALGTVQFGLAYGIAGSGTVVAPSEARSILACAADMGIGCLDTAPGYGGIEPALADLCGPHHFSVTSKIAPLPQGLGSSDAAAFVQQSIATSLARLGPHLSGLLFHHHDDLLGLQGPVLWAAAVRALRQHPEVSLGVSCYSPESLLQIERQFPIRLAQLPGNALDQRIAGLVLSQPMGIHLRSAFLQGLLLQSSAWLNSRLPAAREPMRAWLAWCAARQLSPLHAALGIVKGLARDGAVSIQACVVGVETCTQLEAIWRAWSDTGPLAAAELACTNLAVIDPRTWPSSPQPATACP